MSRAATLYGWLIGPFLVALAAQFLLAGLGVMSGGSLLAHRGLGFLLLACGALLALLASLGGLTRPVRALAAALFLLLALQPVLAVPGLTPAWLRALHVLDAFLIVGVAVELARRRPLMPPARSPAPSATRTAARPPPAA